MFWMIQTENFCEKNSRIFRIEFSEIIFSIRDSAALLINYDSSRTFGHHHTKLHAREFANP